MKKPEIRKIGEIEVVVLPDGWHQGGRFETPTEYLRACGNKYIGKKIMTKPEFKRARKSQLSPTERAQNAINMARAAV